MLELAGLGVLVTRPEHQAMSLCRLLEAHGAAVWRFAAIDIEPLAGRKAAARALEPFEQFDLIVFVSANAVRFGAPLLDQRRDLPLAAIGPATMRALNQAGYRVAVLPSGGFDSEALLADPRLEHVNGRRILIVKGSEGRDALATVLTERGAAVQTLDVYARRRPNPGAAALAALEQHFAAGEIHVITATSLELAENLAAMAGGELRAAFERVHWLVPSARVAAGVRAAGVGAPLLQAASAEDQALLAELLRWRATLSGA